MANIPAGAAIVIIIYLVFCLLLIALSILAFIFWIFMLVDCAKRRFANENEKIAWILIVVLAGVIGALVYYFAVKRKGLK